MQITTIYWIITLILQIINVSEGTSVSGTIKSALNGKCLDVEGNSNEEGTNVRMWNCLNNDAQKWYYDSTTKEIKNQNGKCLDVEGNFNADGTNIRMWGCLKNDAQKWNLNEKGQIVNINGKCLDVEGWHYNEGTNVHLWTCHQGNNQLWYGSFLPVKGGTPSSSTGTIVIETRQTQEYSWIWDDSGEGSDVKDGSFWIPKLNHHLGESFISFVNTFGYGEPTDIVSTIIKAAPLNALKEPKDCKEIWNDSGSGGDYDVWFCRPNPEINYICFGDYVSRTPIHAEGWDGYKCIHKDYVNEIASDQVKQIQKWNDKHSKADKDVQVIQINVNGDPNVYFKMHNSHFTNIDGPFYSFNLYSRTCKITNINSDATLSRQILSGTADTSMTIEYINNGVNVGETQGFGQKKCITSSSTFTHKSGSKLGITTTFGYARTAAVEAKGTKVSTEFSFELSVYGEIWREYEDTTMKSQETCTDIQQQEVKCPGRTTCRRDYTVFTAPNTRVPVSVTVQCGSLTDTIQGSFTATGAASILVTDNFHPLDCVYYTNDYDNRGKGKLPFCDTCTSSTNIDIKDLKCYICRDNMVLIDGECWDDRICIEECKGSIKSPSQTVPHSSSPDFAGRYCINEDITLQSCKTALRRTG